MQTQSPSYRQMFNYLARLTLTIGLAIAATAIASTAIANPSFAAPPPMHSPVPGGIAVVPLPATTFNGTTAPVVRYRDHRVMVIPDSDGAGWQAIVGIGLKAQPGTHELEVNQIGSNATLNFQVKDKAYKEQRITLANKRQVNPYQKDLERIGRERREMDAVFSDWNDSLAPTTRLTLPTKGPISSPFGLRRFFNDQPRNPHSGLDIAAPEGTPIVAPAAGIVQATGSYFFNGNTVMLNHGHGLVTMYCHLSSIEVKPGDVVASGDLIGAVGKTGRVTGAHLHWSVSLNNARIDPDLLLVQQSDNPKN